MKPRNRREFFKSASLAVPAFLAGLRPAMASGNPPRKDGELGMLYDATACVGCKACMASCKRVNGDYGSLAPEAARFDPDAVWDAPEDLSGNTRTIVKLHKEGPRWSYIKHSCMHCQQPACVSVCPVSAMVKDKSTGIVDYHKNSCLGCRYCQIACAFNIPKFQWNATMPQIVKCDLCRNTNLKRKGQPACVEACPVGAIRFGRRGALLAEARARMQAQPGRYVPHIYGEHEAGGTNLLYLAGVPFEKLGVPTLPAEAPAAIAEKVQHTIYKGFVAPVALYGVLGAIALRNVKQHGPPSVPSAASEPPSTPPRA